MVADIEQVDATIDKFLDYARAGPERSEPVDLVSTLERRGAALQEQDPLRLRDPRSAPARWCWAMRSSCGACSRICWKTRCAMAVVHERDGRVEVEAELLAQKVHVDAAPTTVPGSATSSCRPPDPALLPRRFGPHPRPAGRDWGWRSYNKTVTRLGGQLALRRHPDQAAWWPSCCCGAAEIQRALRAAQGPGSRPMQIRLSSASAGRRRAPRCCGLREPAPSSRRSWP